MSNATNSLQDGKNELKAGTGFMLGLSETIHQFESKGYTENLVAQSDHFSCQTGRVKIKPSDIVIDEVVRFENTSDPADQSILYAISVPGLDLKGLFVESYGVYNEELSEEMLEALKKDDTEPSVSI